MMVNAILILSSYSILVFFVVIMTMSREVIASRNAVYLYAVLLGLVAITASYDTFNISNIDVVDLNGSDGEGYYYQAVDISRGVLSDVMFEIRSNYIGYQLVLGVFFKIFGAHLLLGLLLNAFFQVLTVIFSYKFVLLSLKNQRAAHLKVIFIIAYTH